ncbi:MAG: tRNA epoxyqueuosine(34) reductase QueG [Planctomycetota bacterium]|jgi:epoxyqueuosine reductase
MSLTQDIKQKAIELGFDLVGVTDTSPLDREHVQLFTDWLKSGCGSQMEYMHRTFEKRTNPAKLLENAQSVIVVGLNYTPPKTHPIPPDPAAPMGRVANYAQYEDYHSFIEKQLHKLVDFIISLAGTGSKFRICVGSAPLAEKALAARAGLGFIGKNHILINPKLGPQILLGEIITNLKLQIDEPIKNNCSNCNKCIQACPTGALAPDGRFDANKCISYLTIEYKGPIPACFDQSIGDWLFGCDECLLACPCQENAPICKNKRFKFYNDRAKLNLQDVLNLSDNDFDTRFADSPIKRLGLQRLKRNAQICLTNTTP